MGLWILEDKVMEHVPGTTRYFDDPERPQVATHAVVGNLKCDTSGPVPIILVPQPSDDPNDPLNWPLWKRDVIIGVLSVVSIFGTSLGPILAANTLTLSLFYSARCNCSVTFTQVAKLTGYFLLGAGAAATFFVPSARVWGKRHGYLIGTFLVIVGAVWGGLSKSYTSMLWSRILQGAGTAPFETLVNVSIGDLYFVHERGKRMAVTNLAVFGGAFFTPILVGKITHTIGWPWSFYFVAIFTGVCLPLVILFVPETAYRRAAHLNTDMNSTEDIRLYHLPARPSHESQKQLNGSPPETSDSAGEKPSPEGSAENESHEELETAEASPPKKHSFFTTLMPFNGRKSDESYWKLLIRPFPLFAHPAVLWACLIQGTTIGWTVFIGVILAAIFLGPPLFWDEVQTGYAYWGAFVGSIGGWAISGALADWSAKWMTQRNNGIYEPEFRIVLVIPQLLFGCSGLYAFGIVADRLIDFPHVLPIVFFGFEVAGMVIGAVAASLYIVDAHRDIAIEAFTCAIIFKNFLSFALTFEAYDWLVAAGTYKCFMWISSIQISMENAIEVSFTDTTYFDYAA